MSHAGGHATLPGTPSRMGTGGSSLNMTAVIRAVDLESKSVDKRGASAVLGVGSKRAGRGGGDMVDSKQEPSQKPLQAPASLEASTETYTKLTSSLRRNSDYTLSFALIGVLCMMVQVRCHACCCATCGTLTPSPGPHTHLRVCRAPERACVGVEHGGWVRLLLSQRHAGLQRGRQARPSSHVPGHRGAGCAQRAASCHYVHHTRVPYVSHAAGGGRGCGRVVRALTCRRVVASDRPRPPPPWLLVPLHQSTFATSSTRRG